MLIVRNDEIHISKGDDASIELTFSLNGVPYELQEGDKVVFAAKKGERQDELQSQLEEITKGR